MNSGRNDDAIHEPWHWFGERDYAWGRSLWDIDSRNAAGWAGSRTGSKYKAISFD